MIEPTVEVFETAFAQGATLVWTRLVADLETPVSAYLKLTARREGELHFLLESVEGGAARGRYSMIGLDPDVVWRAHDGHAAQATVSAAGIEPFTPLAAPPLVALRALLADSAIAVPAGLPPMAAGVFGYLGYDMVRAMERLSAPKPPVVDVPDAFLIRPTVMVIFDAVHDEIWIVTPARASPGRTARAAYERAADIIEAVVATLEGALPPAAPAGDVTASALAPVSNTREADFHTMIARAKEYILAGDVFQVVLSQRFAAPFTLPAFALYRALRRVNPAPFLSFLNFGDFQIVCSSPEILVRLRDGRVTIRPIAGTRPRGATAEADAILAAELLADEKERSEHLMLLDLGRNDAGRVAETGSVAVTERFFVERYSHVMHIVSNVEARLTAGLDCIDALCAGFPAGTVSGAPKVRAMQIIDELERDRRGPYGGCIGYFGASGEMDTCIVLRTSVVKDGVMHVQAGAGIVHDSDAGSEQRECINKAQALFRAAEEAMRVASRSRRGQ